MGGKALRINRCRGNDHPQIWTFGQQATKIAQQEVNIQAAFVGFVDNDDVVGTQHPITLHFRQQNTVGHEFHGGMWPHIVVIADGIANAGADLLIQLSGNTLGHRAGGQTTRLGVANVAAAAVAGLQAHFGDLCRLSGASFTGDDHYLIVAQGSCDVVDTPTDR